MPYRPPRDGWLARTVVDVSAASAAINFLTTLNSPYLGAGVYPYAVEIGLLGVSGLAALILVVAALRRSEDTRVVRGYCVGVLLLAWGLVFAPVLAAPPHGNPLLLSPVILAASSAAVSMHRLPALATIVGLLSALILLRLEDLGWWVAMLDTSLIGLGAATMRHIVGVVMERYAEVTGADEERANAEARRVAEAARSAERQRWDGLIHDKVIAALLLASRADTPASRDTARTLAADALAALEHSGDPGEGSLVEGIEQRAQRHGLRATIDALVTGAPPAEVTAAIHEAVDEALRNVTLHSGRTEVSVEIRADDEWATVAVRDEGVGFDPNTVDPRRFGVRRSIPGHLRRVGGTATITSAAGRGTTVALAWRAPEAMPPRLRRDGYVPLPTQWQWVPYVWLLVAFTCAVSLDLGGTPFWASIPSALCLAVACWLIQRPRRVHGWGALVCVVAALVLTTLTTTPAAYSDWRHWYLGSCLPILAVLTLSGRVRHAWFITAMGIAVVVGYSWWTGPEYLRGAAEASSQLLLITLLSTLTSVALRRATLKTRAQLVAAADLRAQSRALALASAERERRTAALTRTIVPLLRTVASGDPVDEETRHRAAISEATARDSLLAPQLVTPEVQRAAAVARGRGLRVSLWEGEGSAIEDFGIDRFRQLLVALLHGLPPGSELTAHWRPGHSDLLATVAATGPMTSRLRQAIQRIVPEATVDIDGGDLWVEIA